MSSSENSSKPPEIEELLMKAEQASRTIPLMAANELLKSERENSRYGPAIIKVMQVFDRAGMDAALVVDSEIMMNVFEKFLEFICPPRSVVRKVVKINGVDHTQLSVAILPKALPGIIPTGPPIPANEMPPPPASKRTKSNDENVEKGEHA